MSLPLTRWCGRCGSPVTAVGHHTASGDFDPYSVPVSDAEIEASATAKERYRYHRWQELARFNIAFGKHVGSYELPAAIAAAVSGLSPVIITVRIPIRRSSEKRSRMPPLTISFK